VQIVPTSTETSRYVRSAAISNLCLCQDTLQQVGGSSYRHMYTHTESFITDMSVVNADFPCDKAAMLWSGIKDTLYAGA
jgi:hypothetical protein